MSLRPIRRALLSVSDKTGLLDLARALAERQVELISTGGTRQALVDAGLAVREVSEVTGMPEMLDGRVKTLHPSIHGGILAVRDNAQHQAALRTHGIQPIDLVVCNLYPFEATLSRPGSAPEEIIENIDIGGPTLVRAAAKNYQDVAVLTDPAQYSGVLQELQQHHGALGLATRRQLAAAAFARIAAYDQAISAYFADQQGGEPFPPILHRQWRHRQALRYGENPHQQAAFYTDFDFVQPGVASAEVLHGKELSYNNILDLDSALNLVREFSGPAAVVIKHNNPCGAAVAATLAEAFQLAYEGDPLSAFGGVLAFNRLIDEATAQRIADPKRFIECLIAPGYSPAALQILTGWKKNVRLLSTGPLEGPATGGLVFRQVTGGVLVQEPDRHNDQSDFRELRVVTRRQPAEAELADMRLAWVVCKHVKSNAIVLVKAGAVVGVGAGQMSRVDSVMLAVRKAGSRSRGAVLASDAFFPFADNVEEAARAGVTALVQPGGSLRDEESIRACDQHDLAMVFTGVRHFRH